MILVGIESSMRFVHNLLHTIMRPVICHGCSILHFRSLQKDSWIKPCRNGQQRRFWNLARRLDFRGVEKFPRTPTDFGARYRGVDDADEVDTKVISVATLVMSRILCIEIPRQ
jgi:hypothetical protein